MSDKHPTWAELQRWIDGDSDAGERSRIDTHLASCPACAREAEFARRLHSTLKEGEEEIFLPHLARDVMARIPRRDAFPWYRLVSAVPVAAALAFAVNRLMPAIQNLLVGSAAAMIQASGDLTAAIENRISTIPAVPTIAVPTDPTLWLVLAGAMGIASLGWFFLWFARQTRSL